VIDDDDKPPLRLYGRFARLNPPPDEVAEAVADYKARQEAERAKMAKLKALRLAAEAKAGVKAEAKVKRKAALAAKAKR
jgi:hypothetical protein